MLKNFENGSYSSIFNNVLLDLFKSGLKIVLNHPSMANFIMRTILNQQKLADLRNENLLNGINIPPILIMSVTHNCNLRCKGCYAFENHKLMKSEPDLSKISEIIAEAKSLGISIALIAGGEPLMRIGLPELAESNPEMLFPVFTNGLLLDDEYISKLKKIKNFIPIISIEGFSEDTDSRRGSGVSDSLRHVFEQLKKNNIFYGVSITATNKNYEHIISNDFIKSTIEQGCKIFFYVEYVPVKEGTLSLVLTEEQRTKLQNIPTEFQKKYPALFVCFPGNEQQYNGCLAAGRGFIHINANLDLEPCPFAPFSDANLYNVSLKEALNSKLLSRIREIHNLLTETAGGCALWSNREKIEEMN